MFLGARHHSVLAKSAGGSSYTFIICKRAGKSSLSEKRRDNNMTTLQIIGLALLLGGVLGYGALFLYVLTNDKRREKNGGIARTPRQ